MIVFRDELTHMTATETRLTWLLIEAKRMPIDRLEAAIDSIADDDSDAATRTRAALVAALKTQRERLEDYDGT